MRRHVCKMLMDHPDTGIDASAAERDLSAGARDA